jgi:peptidoglycan/LPS O-acetylase OafA/YrhL
MARRNTYGFWAVTWSLAVEEQFYLTLPGRNPICKAIFCVSRRRRNSMAPSVFMPCRADSLLPGVTAAMLLRNRSARAWLMENTRALWCATIVFFAGVCVFLPHYSWIWGIQMASIGFTWLALFYTVVLLLAVTRPAGLEKRYDLPRCRLGNYRLRRLSVSRICADCFRSVSSNMATNHDQLGCPGSDSFTCHFFLALL